MNKLLCILSRTIVTTFGTTSDQASHPISLRLRRILDRLNVREIIGVNLAGMAFFSAVIMPQFDNAANQVEVILETRTIQAADSSTTITALQWPLSTFGLSQRYYYGHPGLDMTAQLGTPVYPVNAGTVVTVVSSRWGYGNHIVIEHEHNMASLYAHLSQTMVREGQKVTRATRLGSVGSTGWSTGNHLHLEIYRDGTPVNPLDVLPSIRQGN